MKIMLEVNGHRPELIAYLLRVGMLFWFMVQEKPALSLPSAERKACCATYWLSKQPHIPSKLVCVRDCCLIGYR